MSKTTDFGYEKIPFEQKQGRVNEVFTSVARNYDRMNDLMSGGLHRLWKRQFITLAQLKPHHHLLDLAAGTGDLTQLALKRGLKPNHCVMSDINADMLGVGQDRLWDQGYTDVNLCVIDAQTIPFPEATFDRVFIGFGLRNVPDKNKAIASMHRVLKPGGMMMILEFSDIQKPMKPFYDAYAHGILPKLGQMVANDADSYRYLAESIDKHPDKQTLKSMILAQGFASCRVFELNFGLVAIHQAIKS